MLQLGQLTIVKSHESEGSQINPYGGSLIDPHITKHILPLYLYDVRVLCIVHIR